MTSYDHFIRLLVVIGLVLAGLVLTSFLSGLILMMNGMSLGELIEMGQSGVMNLSPGITRTLLGFQHLLIFILPALAFGFIFYRARLLKGLDLGNNPGIGLATLGIVFLLAAYPLVNLTFMANEAITLPSWAKAYEDQAEETLKALMNMQTPFIFLLNLIIIAILPGIGEELIFRGIFQKYVGLLFKSPIVAIWISAFVFSAIHLQFEGFLPRMALGAVLGYLFYWSGNLWVPIIAHAFNNGIQVAIIYFTGMDISTFDDQSSDQLQWWMIPLSIAVMYFIYTSILKNRRHSEPT